MGAHATTMLAVAAQRKLALAVVAAGGLVSAFAAWQLRRKPPSLAAAALPILDDGPLAKIPIEKRQGRVESLWTTMGTSKPMEQENELRCIAGVGIEGDRYATDMAVGRYSISPEPGRQITLIAAEPMERLSQEYGFPVGPHNCRRNVVIRGMHVEDLVGHELRLGQDVRLFVHRSSTPCMYLEGLLKGKGLMNAFFCNSGICCEILQGGVLRTGDTLTVVPESKDASRIVTWPNKAAFVRPSERSAAQKEAMLNHRLALEPNAAAGDPTSQKRLRLFDQAHGRKNAHWDGGLPQY
eukprot:TRINITY_DN33706_c0_g1_i1.p1 TRINITY_DN33706_c0_g1~~TRINITY_DN33706_c0_g1_i1.p1  ORF type:complete len:296 (+),score=39.20 TRINITY_DN33706_c0_g1_i1:76-963(+)